MAAPKDFEELGLSNSDWHDSVVPVLTEQHRIVAANGASFAGRLIELAIMQLRLTVNGISEQELSALIDHARTDPVGGEPIDRA
jgi:hypothetical protein